jgi:hypothetical protein
MNERDIAEQAYNNGYEKGYADGKSKVLEEIAFPRFLVRQPELSKKDVEDILMQSPTIIMDKTEIIPIYPYRWIPVTERLPEGECLAICMLSGRPAYKEMLVGYVGEDTMCESGYICESDGELLPDVTHWMPLPEPPKGE